MERCFRSWPSPTKGWKDWFLRVSHSNEVQWGERKLDQCIRLSLANMERNESLLIVASHFWSDTLNAFVFGHGPASPILADVLMLTGLDISTADNSHLFDTRPSSKVETRAIGGWSGYIQKYRRTGPVNAKEQTTFLNMWLDKFVFCGRSAGPTSVYLSAAERLADGGRFPLGRYLLGSAYHLLHQVARKLLLGQPIGNLGGPWWFINMWLNLHMHKRLEFDLFAQRFPRDIYKDYELDEEESATRSPLNFGEAAIVLPGTGGNEDQVSRFFQTLYEGLTREQRAWMPYEDPDTRFPLTFHPFNDALNKDRDVMMAIITPRAILVNFFGSGKASNPTYEFYNPSALARQLAFGQLPIALCYIDVIKPRETITSNLEWIGVAQLPRNADTDVDLSAWITALFITQAYKQWWEEWKEHLFCTSALAYRGMIDPKYKIPDNTISTLNRRFNPFTLIFHR